MARKSVSILLPARKLFQRSLILQVHSYAWMCWAVRGRIKCNQEDCYGMLLCLLSSSICLEGTQIFLEGTQGRGSPSFTPHSSAPSNKLALACSLCNKMSSFCAYLKNQDLRAQYTWACRQQEAFGRFIRQAFYLLVQKCCYKGELSKKRCYGGHTAPNELSSQLF